MAKIKNHEDLVRDPRSGMVKNKNLADFIAARNRSCAAKEKLARETDQAIEIKSLKREVSELKSMMSDLLVALNKSSDEGRSKDRTFKRPVKQKVDANDDND